MQGATAEGGTADEDTFRAAVLELAGEGGGLPAPLRERLLAALATPRQAASDCMAAAAGEDATLAVSQPLKMEVVPEFTSPRATSTGWLHQALLRLGEASGLPCFRGRLDFFRSKPAAVVVSPGPAVPADCLALRGNASVALRVLPSGATAGAEAIRHVVVEQIPRLTRLSKISVSPRHFSVFGQPAEAPEAEGGSISPYTVPLGSFEYHVAAPAAQAFELAQPVPVRGLQLRFEGEGWGAEYRCIYRIRAFTGAPPLCSGARLAAAVPPAQ